MRKKLLIGLTMAIVLGLGTGTAWFNRSSAQDPPKKAEPAEKKGDDLFDQLKKALEEKKGEPTPPPVIDAPTFPPLSKPAVPTAEPTIPPPLSSVPPPVYVQEKDSSPTPPIGVLPTRGSEGSKPAPAANWTLQPQDPKAITPPQPTKPQTLEFPPSQPPVISNPPLAPVVQPKPVVEPPPPPPTVQVTPVLAKDSPWTLHVQMVNGQTVVTATVNKKHEFKIVCQTLDLQTGKNTLKAMGKVTITGDMMNGSCDHLAIPLMEDRLVLEGGAQVAIQKTATTVSSEKAASFELKGATLDLRISELQGVGVQQTVWPTTQAASLPRDTAGIEGRTVSRTAAADSKQWTPYGVLRRVETKVGTTYTLEQTNGTTVAIAPREGGSLDEYVGRTISVLGRMEQIQGNMKLRVTHIALP